MTDFTTDVIRKIWNDNTGTSYTVRPDSDGLDLVQLDCEELSSFMIFHPAEARKVAAALAACAGEMEARKE
ncbi:hypothetical protein I7G59_06640 [Sinorhizobium meliloti]|uniref:hypothetical protein n=1 Tax=Rhizobium meliloti TaxID=382 RepID=UPI00237FDEAF|nr:hypothetical protein [Sinorhizobium meliloti]MDE3797012.1 hypothetical protein [Sinorhizobium meliloti]